MKIYTLTFNNVNEGFGTYEVSTFINKEDAVEKMEKEYLEKCKEDNITEPMTPTLDNQIDEDYAFIFMEYYWDIFETEI